MSDPTPLEVTVHIAAPPEDVFPWFVEAERYTRWMGSEATLEPSPGGTYRVLMGSGMEASGEFVEIDPPHRVVFSWGWAGDPIVPPGSTRVEVVLEADADGTTVRLLHHDLPTPQAGDHHRQGWELYLGRLDVVVAGGDPGPDPNDG